MPKLIENKLFLEKLAGNFGLIHQWMESGSIERVLEYKIRAEALIELVEIEECGSVGGYDKGQPRSRSLGDRFEWVAKKNGIDVTKFEQRIIDGIELSKASRI